MKAVASSIQEMLRGKYYWQYSKKQQSLPVSLAVSHHNHATTVASLDFILMQ